MKEANHLLRNVPKAFCLTGTKIYWLQGVQIQPWASHHFHYLGWTLQKAGKAKCVQVIGLNHSLREKWMYSSFEYVQNSVFFCLLAYFLHVILMQWTLWCSEETAYCVRMSESTVYIYLDPNFTICPCVIGDVGNFC